MSRRYAFRACWADLTSRNGFQWPWPGGKVRSDDDLDPGNDTACPSHPGDGLCLAKTAKGAASGGIPLHTVLVCSFDSRNVLGEDDHKIRVRGLVRVESVHDFRRVLRGEDARSDHLPTGANLTGAHLAGAYLTGADLAGAYLARAYLTGANLAGAHLAGANLTGANLTGANLAGAYLAGAHLAGANLARAYLTGANLADAYLAGANLTGAYLTGANLARAYLTGADLAGANLTGAHLTDANLTRANLTGAHGNERTILPPGWRVGDTGLIEKVTR